MKRFRPEPWLLLAAVGGMVYPFLVYFCLGSLPPTILVLTALGLLALRMLGLRRVKGAGLWLPVLALAGGGLLSVLIWQPDLAAKAYPVAISLAVAGVFALSLRFPPCVIERIARLSEPDLPPQGVAYTRRVTWVWVIFLLANAAISAATAVWGSLHLWTLWNGLLSYIAMGLLFAGEYLIRRHVRAGQRAA